MGLARICATIATRKDLISLLEQLETENLRFRFAILWALGEHEEFPPPPEKEVTLPNEKGKLAPRYYWRGELRKRAGL